MPKPILLRVDARELATILAALRFHQDENCSRKDQRRSVIADAFIASFATDGDTLRPLSASEIDRLCGRLNESGRNGGKNKRENRP